MKVSSDVLFKNIERDLSLLRDNDLGQLNAIFDLLEIRNENELLKAEVESLRSETYCAYCGKRFPLENTDSTDFIGEHIACCPKHPMVAAQAELNFLKEEVARLTEKADEKEDNLLSARSVITAVRAELLASQVPLGPNSKAKALKVHIQDAIMLMKGQP